jgi:hypothetical protein
MKKAGYPEVVEGLGAFDSVILTSLPTTKPERMEELEGERKKTLEFTIQLSKATPKALEAAFGFLDVLGTHGTLSDNTRYGKPARLNHNPRLISES